MNSVFDKVFPFGHPNYRQCTQTLMDTTDPDITFDPDGVCNHVKHKFALISSKWNPAGDAEAFHLLINRIKREGIGKRYDCILGLSGGLDSSYLALLAWKYGLRPLVMHADTGWNTELAVKNVESIVDRCGFDLHTHVINWNEMRGLQTAFLRAGVPNQDIPQDHAIFAALYNCAAKANIKWVLNGSNFASESILPKAWGYDARDLFHLKSIHRRFGNEPLGKFPRMGHFSFLLRFKLLKSMKVVKLLNYIKYVQKDAIDELKTEMGWRDYGAKHHESRWTRYFQCHFLPRRFGYDKRIAHLSSLILSKQLSKSQAQVEFSKNNYADCTKMEDEEIISRKLGLTQSQFEAYMQLPKHSHQEYPNMSWFTQIMLNIKYKANEKSKVVSSF